MYPVRSNDSSQKRALIRGEFGQVVTDHVHERIHDDKHRWVCYPFDSLGVAGQINFSMVTSSDIVHMLGVIPIKSEALFSIYEDVVVNSAGTSLPIISNKRPGVSAINETVYVNTNITSVGTVLCNSLYIPAGNRVGTEFRSESEFELQTGTTYFFQIESLAASNRGSVLLPYYIE